jgi:hypothetical protein
LLSPPIRLPPLPADGAPLLPPRQQQIIEAAEGYRRSHQINRYGAFSAIASPNSFHFQPIFHCRIQHYAFFQIFSSVVRPGFLQLSPSALIFAFAFRSAPQFRHAATLDLSRHTLPTPPRRRRIFISLFAFTLPITTFAAIAFIKISRAITIFTLTPPAIAAQRQRAHEGSRPAFGFRHIGFAADFQLMPILRHCAATGHRQPLIMPPAYFHFTTPLISATLSAATISSLIAAASCRIATLR